MPQMLKEYKKPLPLIQTKQQSEHPPVPKPEVEVEYNLASPVISYIKGEIDNHTSDS